MKLSTSLRTLAAGVVAGVAAIGSYTHMRDLALDHGQGVFLASLLPLSVDGLLVVASIVMTEDREAGRPASGWARVSFVTGVVASVAANVEAAPDDAISRLISAWPAVALLLTVEMLIGKRRTVAKIDVPATEPAVELHRDPMPPTNVGKTPDAPDTAPVSPLVAPLPQDAGGLPAIVSIGQSNAERVRLVAARLPQSATLSQIAAEARCSERTAGRYLADGHPAKPGKGKTATAEPVAAGQGPTD